ncbi:molybdenum cofactor biosynthesis protein MoaE [Pirellulaceae bacterium SH467]
MIEITQDPIPVAKLLELAFDESCGATVAFIGTTRRWTDGRETAYLEYQAYTEMALAKMEELSREAHARWPIQKLCLVHRVGIVEIKEPSVAVVVSTPHRAEAFEAGQWLIDELKRRVPIWKKEWFAAQDPTWIHPLPASSPNSSNGSGDAS